MRISGNFDISFCDKTTLHDYSLMLYAFGMRNADNRLTEAYSAIFSRIAEGLNGKIKISDVYDHDQELREILGKAEEITDKMRLFANINKSLGGSSDE